LQNAKTQKECHQGILELLQDVEKLTEFADQLRKIEEEYGLINKKTYEFLQDISKYVAHVSLIMCRYIMSNRKGKSIYIDSHMATHN
jgi:DNA-binding MltR family transcriptional regulator